MKIDEIIEGCSYTNKPEAFYWRTVEFILDGPSGKVVVWLPTVLTYKAGDDMGAAVSTLLPPGLNQSKSKPLMTTTTIRWVEVRNDFESLASQNELGSLNRCGYSDDEHDEYADAPVQQAWVWFRAGVLAQSLNIPH